MRTRASNFSTVIALFISFGWSYLVGLLVLQNSRPNEWYDMDFSIWVVCALYAFVHLFIGKILCLLIEVLVNRLEKAGYPGWRQRWTEDFQLVFGSMWPISVPAAVALFLIIYFFKKKPGESTSR